MAFIRSEKYEGHRIEFWPKSFRIDGGPVILAGDYHVHDVYRIIDAIEGVTRKKIRAALGVA